MVKKFRSLDDGEAVFVSALQSHWSTDMLCKREVNEMHSERQSRSLDSISLF